VGLGSFITYAQVSKDKFDDITRRIVCSFGLDWSNENAKIDFEMYCKIKCFLTFNTLEESDLVKIWIKILNPSSVIVQNYEQFFDLFERFARGSM
jgi:hypothetical protein